MRNFKNLTKKEKAEYISILILYPFFLIFSRLGKSFKFFADKKRQLAASALSVAIVLTAIPALSLSVFAGTTGSTSVKLFNKYEMVNGNSTTYLVANDDYSYIIEGVKTTSDNNYLAKYEPSSNTLTIQDLDYGLNGNEGGVYANGDLNLRLVGSNTIVGCAKFGVKADGNLKIYGDGALFIGCERRNGRASAICAGGNIELRGNNGGSQPTIVAVGNGDYTVKAGGSINVSYVNLTLYSAWDYSLFNKLPSILGGKITVSTDNMGKDPTDNIDDSKLTKDYKYLRMTPDGYRDAYDTASLKEAAADKNCKVINFLALDSYDHEPEYAIGISDVISFNHDVKLVSLGSWIRREDSYKGAFFKIGDDGSNPNVTFMGLSLYGYGVKSNDTVVGNDSAIIVESGSLTLKGSNSLEYFNAGSANGAAINVKSGATLNLNGRYIWFFRNETTGLGGAIYNEGTLNIKSARIISNKAADGGGIYSCNFGQISLVGNTGYVDVAYNTTTDGTRNNLKLANWKRIKTDDKVLTRRKIYITPCENPTLTQSMPVISASSNYSMGSFASDIHGVEPVFKDYAKEIHMAVTHPHCVCGMEHEEIGDHKNEDVRWFEGWDQTDSLPKEPGNYYLKNDIVLKDSDHHAYLYNGVNICMNGHDIYATYNAREVLSTIGNWIKKDGDNNYKLYPWDQEGVVTNCSSSSSVIRHKGVTVEDVGRGVQVDANANVSFYNIRVTDNKTKDQSSGGGGIYVSNAKVSLYNCRITKNSAYHYGGGISGAQSATINIYNSEISENTADSFGGGIEIGNSSKLRIENTEIGSNKSTYNGGGISVVANNCDISLKNTTMLGNYAKYYGGGIYSSSPVKLSGDTYVAGNYSGHQETSNQYLDNIYINTYAPAIQLTGPLTGQYKSGITSVKVPRVVVTGNNYKITENDLNNFKSDDVDNYELVLKDNEITMKTKLKNLKASDISVTLPSNLTYDGNAKSVKVAAKSGVNCGSLYVEYYNDKGELLDGYPRDAGDYTFKVKANANSVYNGALLSSPEWKFTIKKCSLAAYQLTFGKINNCIFNVNGATPDLSLTVKATGEKLIKGKDYTLSYENNKKEGYATVKYQLIGNYAGTGSTSFYIRYGSVTDAMYSASLKSKNYYYNDDVTLYAKEGYEIGADDHTFSNSVTFTEEIPNYDGNFYVKAANGDVYRGSYGIDKTKPNVKISFKQNVFKTFLNKITFGLFYKNEQVDVTITATDSFSGTDSYYYQLVKTQDEYDENGTWTRGNKLYLRDKMTFIVYAKVVDKAGNVSIINSDGAVIYDDSYFKKRTASFDKNVEVAADTELTVALKGNTIKSVKNGEKLLTLDRDYTVSDTGITFKKDYLNKFEAGKIQTFTVAFNPQGIITDKVSIEDTCNIKIIDTTHRHIAVHHNRVEATCLKDGNIEYYTCTGCNEKFTDINCKNKVTDIAIPKIDHKNAVKTEAKPETCTEIGNLAYWYCPDCKLYFADNNNSLNKSSSKKTNSEFIKKALGHKFTARSNDVKYLIKAATCTKEAVYCFKCERCDACDKSLTYKYGNPLGHKFENYVYNNNATYFADGTETAKCENSGCKETDTKTASGTKLIDSNSPTTEISIKDNKFTSLLNNITFGLFFKNTDTVSVKAEDKESGLKSVKYFVSDKEITDFEDIKWSEYKDSFAINPDGKYIVYVKVEDKVGNSKLISSDGLVIDSLAPQTNITNGKTYCSAFEVTVSDENIDLIELNRKPVTPVNGKITVSPKSGKQTLKAQDKSGNITELEFTVNDGHVYNEGKITTEPTAAKEGVKTFTCVHCKDSYTEPVAKTKPVIIEGMNGKFVRNKSEILSFRSDAALADFLNVAVDGKVIDSKYYTTAEGSTIVRLSEEYLKTLSDGSHTLDIISLSGTASTTFTIEAKSSENSTLSPKTGFFKDNALWLIILIAVWTAVGVVVFVQRKKIFK